MMSMSKLADAWFISAIRFTRRAGSMRLPLFTVSARLRMLATSWRPRRSNACLSTLSWLAAMPSVWSSRALEVSREAMTAVTMLDTTRVTISTPTTL